MIRYLGFGAALLVLLAFTPLSLAAQGGGAGKGGGKGGGPGGGGQIGGAMKGGSHGGLHVGVGQQGGLHVGVGQLGGVHAGVGQHGFWHGGRWYPGQWGSYDWRNPRWYGGSYYPYPYSYAVPYTVARPIENPPPGPVLSGAPIRITNPANNAVALNFTLNGTAYSIQPGQSQEFAADRLWVINFSRGGSFGLARYSLEPGLYTFTPTDRGWELFRSPLATLQASPMAPGTTNVAPPSNPGTLPVPQY